MLPHPSSSHSNGSQCDCSTCFGISALSSASIKSEEEFKSDLFTAAVTVRKFSAQKTMFKRWWSLHMCRQQITDSRYDTSSERMAIELNIVPFKRRKNYRFCVNWRAERGMTRWSFLSWILFVASRRVLGAALLKSGRKGVASLSGSIHLILCSL